MKNAKIMDPVLNSVQDLGEVAIDSLLDNSFWKDIPVLSTVVNVVKVGTTIKDNMFLRKLYRFLYEYKQLDDVTKKKIQERIISYKEKCSLGEEIVSVIDSFENSKKAALIVCVLKFLTQDDLDVDVYLVLIDRIAKCYYADLMWVKKFETEDSKYCDHNDKIPGSVLSQLYFSGFLDNVGFDGGDLSDTMPCGQVYQLNQYGVIMRNVLIQNNF